MKFHLQGVPKTNGPFGEVHPSSKGTFLGHPVGVQIGKKWSTSSFRNIQKIL